MIKWLKRADLYEKVWTTPVIRLATEFGISDVALHKICRRHKIPVPPRGYWAKLAAGKKVASFPYPRSTTRAWRTSRCRIAPRPPTQTVC